jgi:hypothetical protein
MRQVWIIGGGRFGLRAAETIRDVAPRADLLVVEKDLLRCRRLQARGFQTLAADGSDFLARHLKSPLQKQWIVAAIPLHLAYEWVRARLAEKVRIEPYPVPAEFVCMLPNANLGDKGQLFASNADSICPPDCSEAGSVCTATGRRRPHTMYAFIQRIHAEGVKILVVRSYQLAAGVGGLRPRDLFEALRQIQCAKTPVLLATACKCHAVLNSFKIISKS